MSRFRGADAVVRALVDAGVRRIFTLSGNHVMPIFDATIGSGIELIHVRHEAAAVHMADAWGRLTGEAGVALVTGGPGHANAVSALYTALMADSPIVLLSGHAPIAELGMGAFQEMRQADMAAPVTKASWTCEGDPGGDVAKALAIARHGAPGPVHLSLPVDLLEGGAKEGARTAAPLPDAPEDVSPILERLSKAARPLILTGRAKTAALEEASGIPVVAMESPRGIADPSLGAFWEVLGQADCILLLGKRLDFTLRFGRAPAIAKDCEILELERPAMASLLEGARPAPRSGWLDDVRAAIDYRPRSWDEAVASVPGRLHPVQALRPLQSILDSHPDSVFVSDGGEFGQWAQACLRAPHRVINGVAGAIGPSLPFALAARLAHPKAPVIAAMGDGTFGFHPAELDTAVRHGLAFVVVVGNDARWNAEFQIQLREFGAARTVATSLRETRYDEVARAFGGHGEMVTDARALLPAARRALESRRPSVLNVLIEGQAAPSIAR